MTEDEAKKKACCGPPTVAAATLLGRKDVETKPLSGLEWGLCVGSACMAWRWRIVANPAWKPQHQMLTTYPENPYSATPAGVASATDGFCGLAGSPQ